MIKYYDNGVWKVISGKSRKDVEEFATQSDFPATGEKDKIYIDKSTNSLYRYDENTSRYVSVGGSGGGTSYVAGNGIVITDDEISVDSSVVATKSDLPTATSDLTNDSGFITSADITGKEDTSNKVTSMSASSTDVEYPSAKVVYDTTSDLQDQINNLKNQGRYLSNWNATTGLPMTNPTTELPYDYRAGDYYIVGVVLYPAYDSSSSYDTGDKVSYDSKSYECLEDGVTGAFDSTKWSEITLTLYKPTGSQYTGVASSSQETDFTLKIGDEYVYDGTQWVYQANAPIDLDNYVDISSAQSITGLKKFNNINVDIIRNSNGLPEIYVDNQVIRIASADLIPYTNNSRSLGTSVRFWKDLYLAGSLKDGTNSVSVADIAGGTFNVIDASDIVSNTLTQAQYDLITNGKPTLIKGTMFGDVTNAIFTSQKDVDSYLVGKYVTCDTVGTFRISSTKAISKWNSGNKSVYGMKLEYLNSINGLTIPDTPSSPSTNMALAYKTNNTLAYLSLGGTITDTSNTTFTGALSSKNDYVFEGAMTSITITAFDITTGDGVPVWSMSFTAGSGCSVTLPEGSKWVGGTAPTFTSGKTYKIVVSKFGSDYLAVAGEF